MSCSAPEARFAGATVLVTGGAGGLGRAIGRAFTDAGAQVVLADLDQEAGLAAARELGGPAVFRVLDVPDEASWSRVLDELVSERGRLDVLVNNAGVFQPDIAFEDMPLEVWRRHFSVNSDGVFLGCKHAIRRMKADSGGGAIVNIASGMSIKAVASASAYCASKASALMTTRTAAAAAGPYGVRVNAILPGAVDTEMLRGGLPAGGDEESFLQGLARLSALGRLALPGDIARGVLFLADPDNSAITGVHLAIDGGNLVGA